MTKTDYPHWFEFVQSKIFSKQIAALPSQVVVNIQRDLVQDPYRGDLVKGTHGVRKARAADPAASRGKSGSYRYLFSTLNTLAGFTCYICSAKMSRQSYRQTKNVYSLR